MYTRGINLEENIFKIRGNKLTLYSIGNPKTVTLPEDVVVWIKNSKLAKRIIKLLCTHARFRIRLSNPGAIRSMVLYLYARRTNIAPYALAKKYGVAPEQLYRIERGLKKDRLYKDVIIMLDMDADVE